MQKKSHNVRSTNEMQNKNVLYETEHKTENNIGTYILEYSNKRKKQNDFLE